MGRQNQNTTRRRRGPGSLLGITPLEAKMRKILQDRSYRPQRVSMSQSVFDKWRSFRTNNCGLSTNDQAMLHLLFVHSNQCAVCRSEPIKQTDMTDEFNLQERTEVSPLTRESDDANVAQELEPEETIETPVVVKKEPEDQDHDIESSNEFHYLPVDNDLMKPQIQLLSKEDSSNQQSRREDSFYPVSQQLSLFSLLASQNHTSSYENLIGQSTANHDSSYQQTSQYDISYQSTSQGQPTSQNNSSIENSLCQPTTQYDRSSEPTSKVEPSFKPTSHCNPPYQSTSQVDPSHQLTGDDGLSNHSSCNSHRSGQPSGQVDSSYTLASLDGQPTSVDIKPPYHSYADDQSTDDNTDTDIPSSVLTNLSHIGTPEDLASRHQVQSFVDDNVQSQATVNQQDRRTKETPVTVESSKPKVTIFIPEVIMLVTEVPRWCHYRNLLSTNCTDSSSSTFRVDADARFARLILDRFDLKSTNTIPHPPLENLLAATKSESDDPELMYCPSLIKVKLTRDAARFRRLRLKLQKATAIEIFKRQMEQIGLEMESDKLHNVNEIFVGFLLDMLEEDLKSINAYAVDKTKWSQRMSSLPQDDLKEIIFAEPAFELPQKQIRKSTSKRQMKLPPEPTICSSTPVKTDGCEVITTTKQMKLSTQPSVGSSTTTSGKMTEEEDDVQNQLPKEPAGSGLVSKTPSKMRSLTIFRCNKCSKLFKTQIIFRQHYALNHSRKGLNPSLNVEDFATRLWRCKQCGKYAEDMRSHRQQEHQCMCEICGKVVTCVKLLEKHMAVHRLNEPLLCQFCGKRYACPQSLKFHIMYHKGTVVKKFTCDVCNKRFKDGDKLRKHKLIHTDEKPYECTHCGRRFTQQYNMFKHTRIHTGDKPYACNLCDESFNHNVSLKNHKKKVHGIDWWNKGKLTTVSLSKWTDQSKSTSKSTSKSKRARKK